MAGVPVIQCVGPSYFLSDRKSAVQRAVNLYMREVEGVGENKQVVLDSAPGLTALIDFGVTVRGSYSTDSRKFVVAGSTLYETTSGSAVSLGSLLTASGSVSMKHGRDQLVIVDGAYGYVFSLINNTFAQITSSGWRGSNWVDELDGYFIFSEPDTDQFYLSAIDNGSDLNALDFSSADANPDNIGVGKVSKRELYLFGTRSTEVWIDSGDADFPFVRYNSTPIDVGVVGPKAVIRAADTLFFVGQTERGSGTLYMFVGHQPVRVSTQAIEEQLADSTDISQCSMWTYQSKGNEFIGINAPGVDTTWVYDASSKQWHERAELVSGAWQPSRVSNVVILGTTHYAIGLTKEYVQSDDALTLDGDPLVCERTWPHLMAPSAEMMNFRSLELQCTTGYGGNITLEISNDGGFTWGPPLMRSLGAIGRWMERVRWMFLGAARDRVFRLRCSDDVPFVIHGATIDAR